MFRISYAQNREDFIIKAFFPDVRDGFYIDVGASDPDEDSVTKLFYDAGWHGINIEPLAAKIKLLNKKRTRDTNLAIGLADQKGVMHFRQYRGHGLSTFSREMMDGYEGSTNTNTAEYEDVEVPVDTLKNVLKSHDIGHIHFMKVDVEGFELNVLRGNDWKKFRPELLCIEANHISKEADWHSFIKQHDYTKVFHDGLNEYFLAKESMRRLDDFNYPETFLVGGHLVKWSTMNEIRAIEARTAVAERDKKTLEKELHATYTRAEALQDRLDNPTIRAAVGSLLRAVRRRLGL